MATLKRVRVGWNGWSGGPGVSTFYWDGAATPDLAALKTLITSWASLIPVGISLQIENTGQEIDVATGKAIAAWTGPAQTAVSGSGTGGYAAPTGLYLQWKSGVFLGGREMRGKTFVVPIIAGAYDSSGTIVDSTRTGLVTAMTTFIGSQGTSLRLWSRKSAASVSVSSGSVPDKAVVLTSRRA